MDRLGYVSTIWANGLLGIINYAVSSCGNSIAFVFWSMYTFFRDREAGNYPGSETRFHDLIFQKLKEEIFLTCQK